MIVSSTLPLNLFKDKHYHRREINHLSQLLPHYFDILLFTLSVPIFWNRLKYIAQCSIILLFTLKYSIFSHNSISTTKFQLHRSVTCAVAQDTMYRKVLCLVWCFAFTCSILLIILPYYFNFTCKWSFKGQCYIFWVEEDYQMGTS